MQTMHKREKHVCSIFFMFSISLDSMLSVLSIFQLNLLDRWDATSLGLYADPLGFQRRGIVLWFNCKAQACLFLLASLTVLGLSART